MLSNFSTNYGNKILKTTTYKFDIDRIWGEISTLFNSKTVWCNIC